MNNIPLWEPVGGLFDFLNTQAVSESDKQRLIDTLNNSNRKFGNTEQNSFEYLFNNNVELVNLLSNMKNKN
jgi:hypothetical protein